jgi:molybdopterin/thiamine biosynthesis adenylyltransferase
MKKKTDQAQYISLRPDVEIQFSQTKATKAFLAGKEIAEIELDDESHPVFLILLPYLDGTKTVEAIIKALQAKNIAESAIVSCLDFLQESGFIYQFSRPQDIYQAANYAWRTDKPQEILDRLAKSRVLVQGQKDFCEFIADGLIAGGVNFVKAFPSATPLNLAWEAWAKNADLVILFGESSEQVSEVNAWCVKNQKALIVGWWRKFTVSFGPILVPGVTACQTCIHERQGNLPYPDLSSGKSLAGSLPMVISSANFLAGICIDFLSGAGLSKSLTSIHEIDLRLASFADYPALKNPRCPVCSRLKTYPEGAVIDA